MNITTRPLDALKAFARETFRFESILQFIEALLVSASSFLNVETHGLILPFLPSTNLKELDI